MGGLARRMPLLALFFCAGGIALAGAPLTAGYVSKDAILTAVYSKGFTLQWSLLLASALLTAFYTTRLIMVVFMGESRDQKFWPGSDKESKAQGQANHAVC